MAGHGGPDLVQDGLVLSLDAADKNSYPGSGTTWTDLSPNGNDGTITNATFSTAGGGSMAFDGSGDYVDCGHDTTLDAGTSDFTACCWFKLVDDGNHHDIISKGTSLGTGYGWALSFYDGSGSLYFDCGDGTTRVNVYTAISHNTWYHVAVTRNNAGNLSELYINGVLDVTAANALDDLGDGSQDIPFKIGSSASARYLNGSVTNVGFWSRVLTATEITQNFNAQRSRFSV